MTKIMKWNQLTGQASALAILQAGGELIIASYRFSSRQGRRVLVVFKDGTPPRYTGSEYPLTRDGLDRAFEDHLR